jgi:hypothetical protein
MRRRRHQTIVKVEVNNGFGNARQVRSIVEANEEEIIGDPTVYPESTR